MKLILSIIPVLLSSSLKAAPLKDPSPSPHSIPGIEAGFFQKEFNWIALEHPEKGILLFFDKQMTPVLKLSNVGKLTGVHTEESLLGIPLLELEFERCYRKDHQTYTATVGELFEIHDNKLQKIYSYTKQLFYTVKENGHSKQVIFKGMLKADEDHKNTVRLVIQTNGAIHSLKPSYTVGQFTVDETASPRSIKYNFMFTDQLKLDTPPIDINLLGGNSDYYLLNNCEKK